MSRCESGDCNSIKTLTTPALLPLLSPLASPDHVIIIVSGCQINYFLVLLQDIVAASVDQSRVIVIKADR